MAVTPDIIKSIVDESMPDSGSVMSTDTDDDVATFNASTAGKKLSR